MNEMPATILLEDTYDVVHADAVHHEHLEELA